MENTIHPARLGAPPKLARVVSAVRTRALSTLHEVAWLGPLLGRLAIGVLFAGTGWVKVHDLDMVRDFFSSLHIPWPGFHAALVAYAELLCGSAIVLGLLTRLATLPLLVSMAVAIVTARAGDIGSVLDFLSLEEFLYLAVLLMLLVGGPGKVSLDHLLARRFARDEA